ncbi:YadA-like family protein, partial [Bartonella sp. MR63HLJHH]|uniref:YadA-like family protein n=2 Tax=unclassified Bartonella TaxID=2645622 RepID=UPI0035D08298
ITLGGKDKTAVGLHNVADGKIAKDSRDVITGGQVNTIGEDVAKFLGGNASFEKGIFKGPIYNLSSITTDGTATEKSYNDVGTAFAGLDTNIKNVNARIKEVSEGVAQDSLLWSDKAHAFVAQHEKREEQADGTVVVTQENSKITSLAAGKIAADSTDAINGSQIYSMSEMVGSYFGGGAGYDNEGKWIAPTFTIKTVKDDGTEEEKKYNTVAEALADVGTSFTNVKNDITNVVSNSLVKWNEEQKIIKIGGEKEGGVITLADNKNTARTLSGVKDAEKNDEAVNKGQLDENVTKLSDDIEEVRSVAVLYDEEEASEEVSTLTRTAPKINKNSVTFGDPKTGTVALHNVAAGKIAKDSHDAVNGDQLHSLGNNVATYFGGGATFADGAFTAPTYKISNVAEDGKATEKSYNDVGSAFAGLDTSVKNVNTHLTNVENKFTQKIDDISKEVKGDALLWSDKVHAFVAQHEKKEEKEDSTVVVTQENSKITSLAAGAVSETSTDAVNGSQLHTLGTGVATSLGGGAVYKDGKWTAPSFKVKTIKEDGSAVEEQSYNSVAEAFAGVGSSFTNIHNEINKEISKVVGDSLVKQDETTKVINIGKEVEGSEINIANKTGTDRTLSGVKAATKDNEAVNKGQLEKGLTDLSNSLQSDESAVVHYDKKDDKIDYANVTLGKAKDKTAVGLHNVAAGKIAKDSHDAITGGQVNTIGEDVAKFLGGDAAFTNGALTQPTYKLSHIATDGVVTESSFQGVGTAFAGLDDNIKTVNARIKEVSEGVAHDSLLWSDKAHAFVAQHEKREEGDDGKVVVTQENSKITSLAAGSIVSGSSDAVTGGQIYELQKQFAGYFGGGAGYNEKGEWQAPNYNLSSIDKDGKVTDKSHTDVGSAFKGLDDNIKTVNARIKEVSEGVAQDSLSWSKTEGAFVALHGEGDNRKASKITSLAAGSIASGSSDAVNGGQIYSLNQTLAKYFGGDAKYEDDEWSEPTFTLKTYNADGTEGDPQEHHNVTEAFAGIDKNFTNVVNDFKEQVTNITESMQGDALLWNESAKAFVAKHGEKDGEKTNSKITSLAAGSIASGSSDAVNGGQIYDLNQSLAKYFGGDAKYDGDGWVLPGFKLMTFQEDGSFEEEDYDSIAAAFAGINKVFKNLHNEISENIEQNALLWSDDAGAFVAQHEKEGKKDNSKITFLAEGKISEDSTDAINGGQIYTLQQTFASYFGGGAGYDKEGNWQGPKFYVQVFNKDGTKGDKEERNNVSEAFDVVNDSMSTINDRIKEVEKDVASNGLNWNEEKGSYDASHADDQGVKSPSKIINVEDGKVDKDSKEAVNGGQLWETQQMITDQVKDIETKVTDGSVQYDKDETGKKTNTVTLVGGDDSSPVLIDNVADGKIEKDSKEAVNGGQLHDYTEQQMKTVLEDANKYTDEKVSSLVNNGVNEAKSYTDMKFETLNYAIEDVRKEARQAAAIGLAVSNLRYYDIPGSLSVSFGSGLWRSQSAFAIGAGYTSEDGNIRSNVSITSAGGHWGIGAGITLRLR